MLTYGKEGQAPQRCSAGVNGILLHSPQHKSQPAVSKSTPKLN